MSATHGQALARLKDTISTIDPWQTHVAYNGMLAYSHAPQTGHRRSAVVAADTAVAGGLWIQLALVPVGEDIDVIAEVTTRYPAVAARAIIDHLHSTAEGRTLS